MTEIKQVGRIIFEGLEATKFWVRALDLENELGPIKLRMQADSEARCAAPIIAEYQLDSQLSFIYVIIVQIDYLGLHDGSGVIFYTSPERFQEVIKVRDEMADEIVDSLKAKPLVQGMEETGARS